jgi:hypothetical protein
MVKRKKTNDTFQTVYKTAINKHVGFWNNTFQTVYKTPINKHVGITICRFIITWKCEK